MRVRIVARDPDLHADIVRILTSAGLPAAEERVGPMTPQRESRQIDVIVIDAKMEAPDHADAPKPAQEGVSPRLLRLRAAPDPSGPPDVSEEDAERLLKVPFDPPELVAAVRGLIRLRRAQLRTARETRRALLVTEVAVAVNQGGDLEATLRRCAEALLGRLGLAAAGIWEHETRSASLVRRIAAGRSVEEGFAVAVPLARADDLGRLRERRPHLTSGDLPGPLLTRPGWLEEGSIVAFCGHRLVVDRRLVGVLAVFAEREFDELVPETVASTADVLAAYLVRARAEEALRDIETAARRDADKIRQLEREIEDLERLAGPQTTAVTARAFGSAPLRETHPATFEEAVEAFERLIGLALEERGHRVQHGLSEEVRSLSDRLGSLRAGPRDVIDVYAAALRRSTGDAGAEKERACVEEGRMLVLELMGNLVSYYRTSAVFDGRGPSRTRAGGPGGTP